MATTNPVLTNTWTLIVTAGDDFMLELPTSGQLFGGDIEAQIAISNTESVPTVTGHTITARESEGINRNLIGPGYVYARVIGISEYPAVLTAWTPA